ncbi:hypothetical protein CVU37_01005 [candidate division BRC1 bacterium HGW-BRC1-1]|jgi:hypothetical protein|nr:MAG: hypothetical protein CVU37_01005 [candidate division BRC1 bacterium HGW-BRC1-1]
MMKIGFIDHHLENYHADVFHKLLNGPIGAGKVEIVAAYESDPKSDLDWCKEKGVPRASSAAEVVDKCDALMVLAPDNLVEHLKLGREALASGKPTLVDKMLSPVLADAREIIEIAEKHNTPLISSSSLRFSTELEELIARLDGPVTAVYGRGFGNFPVYGIHTIAPAMRLLGDAPVKRVIDTGMAHNHLVTIDDGTRRTFLEVRQSSNQNDASPWMVGVMVSGRLEVALVKKHDDFYANLMRETVKFFETRQSPMSTLEMLRSVAVQEAAEFSLKQGGQWVDVNI